jgi:hypothetical protein
MDKIILRISNYLLIVTHLLIDHSLPLLHLIALLLELLDLGDDPSSLGVIRLVKLCGPSLIVLSRIIRRCQIGGTKVSLSF